LRTQFIHAFREEFLKHGPLRQLLSDVLTSGLSKHDLRRFSHELTVAAKTGGQIGTEIDFDPVSLSWQRGC
jgi:hypothetical protein